MNLSRGTVGGHHEAGGSPSAKAEQSGEMEMSRLG
jgi:hypothetical protein